MRPNLILALLLLSGCAARMPFSAHPGEALPDYVLEAWEDATVDLLELEPPLHSDPRRVSPYLFTWIEQTKPLRCGDHGPGYGGCFSAKEESHVIQFMRTRRVLVHEAKHAIAFAAGDPRWREIPHADAK